MRLSYVSRAHEMCCKRRGLPSYLDPVGNGTNINNIKTSFQIQVANRSLDLNRCKGLWISVQSSGDVQQIVTSG